MFELAAGGEGGEDHLYRGQASIGVGIDGDAAAIIGDGAGAVGVDLNFNVLGKASEGFIDGVVDDFVDQVMKTARVVAADVHAGARADVLDIIEGADHGGVIDAGRRHDRRSGGRGGYFGSRVDRRIFGHGLLRYCFCVRFGVERKRSGKEYQGDSRGARTAH